MIRMSLLPGLTYSAPGVALYGGGGGGGGGGTNSFSTINVSTINIQPNGNINYQGSLNFNQGITGAVIFKSTLSVIDGATPATAVVVEAPNNTGQFQLGIGNDNKMFISSSGTALTWNGGFLSGLANVTTSSIGVSSINGSAYPPASALTNFNVPFIGGSVVGNLYNITVASNTSGLPVQLTSTLVTNAAHTYLVSYVFGAGSNIDTAAYTQIELNASAAGEPTIQNLSNSTNWFISGQAGAKSMLISGAASLFLQAGTNSGDEPSYLSFDTAAGFRVTDLGV